MSHVVVASADAYTDVTEIVGSTGAAGDSFGAGMAVSGDYMIVGAPLNDDLRFNAGAAHIFERNPGTGLWSEVLKVLPTGTTNNSMYFGLHCGAGGDRLFVNCMGDDEVAYGAYPSGAIYVYLRSGGVWTQETKLRAPADYYRTCWSFCVSSDGLMVCGVASNATGVNVAYYWHYSGGAWNGPFALPRVDGFLNDGFLSAVAMSPDKTTIAIGAAADNDVGSNSGSVYVWTGTPAGGYTLQQKVLSNNPAVNQYFGVNVGLHNDTLAVSSRHDVPSDDEGLIQIFTRSGGVWSHVRSIQGVAIFPTDYLGWNGGSDPYIGEYGLHFLDANTLIAPSPVDSSYMSNLNQGSVWCFTATTDWATGYTAKAIWPDMTGSPTASKFGACVAVVDDRIYISRPAARLNGSTVGSVLEISASSGFPWVPPGRAATYVKRALDSAAPSPPPIGAYVTWTTTDPAGAYGGALPYGGPLVGEVLVDVILGW